MDTACLWFSPIDLLRVLMADAEDWLDVRSSVWAELDVAVPCIFESWSCVAVAVGAVFSLTLR